MKESKIEPKIVIQRSAHGTLDVIIYDMPNINLVKWFELMDIWGSKGYDRFNDDGLYFELPCNMCDIIETLPFISSYGIKVVNYAKPVSQTHAVAPIIGHDEYLKYGFAVTRQQSFSCPSCHNTLNAGPCYQPKYCDQCGQPLDFSNVVYEDTEFLRCINMEDE